MLTEDYVALRIIELCEKHKISRYRLSQLTGMSQTALGKIVSKESIPTIPTIEKIVMHLELRWHSFLPKTESALTYQQVNWNW